VSRKKEATVILWHNFDKVKHGFVIFGTNQNVLCKVGYTLTLSLLLLLLRIFVHFHVCYLTMNKVHILYPVVKRL